MAKYCWASIPGRMYIGTCSRHKHYWLRVVGPVNTYESIIITAVMNELKFYIFRKFYGGFCCVCGKKRQFFIICRIHRTVGLSV